MGKSLFNFAASPVLELPGATVVPGATPVVPETQKGPWSPEGHGSFLKPCTYKEPRYIFIDLTDSMFTSPLM